jgi:nitrogen fixation protein NifU and related proteins
MNDHDSSLIERLHQIYSKTTVDHILNPRNDRSLPNPDGFAAYSSGCGETMKIWLKVDNGIVIQTGFWTDGCAATVACGSMATHLIVGKSAIQSLALNARDIVDALKNLPEGNHHCAELAANALRMALKDYLAMDQQPWKKLYRKES